MRYFLGIEPPFALAASVLRLQREWTTRALPPHITVKAPCGLSSDAAWLPTVRKVCRHFAAIQVQIDGIGSFGSSVLYLRVLSTDLIGLHNRLLEDLNVSSTDQDACFEGPRYFPHLTLLQAKSSQAIPQEIIAGAAKNFLEPVFFRAESLAVYCKDPDGKYIIYERIPLQHMKNTKYLTSSDG